VWGEQGVSGLIPRLKDNDVIIPTKIHLPNNPKIIDVSFSDKYSAFVCEAGHLYVHGFMPGETENLNYFKQVDTPKITHVFAQKNILFAIDTLSHIYTWANANPFSLPKAKVKLDPPYPQVIQDVQIIGQTIYAKDKNNKLKQLINDSYRSKLLRAIQENKRLNFETFKYHRFQFSESIEKIIHALKASGQGDVFLTLISDDMLPGELNKVTLNLAWSFEKGELTTDRLPDKLRNPDFKPNELGGFSKTLRNICIKNSSYQKDFIPQVAKGLLITEHSFRELSHDCLLSFPTPSDCHLGSLAAYKKVFNKNNTEGFNHTVASYQKANTFDNALKLFDILYIAIQDPHIPFNGNSDLEKQSKIVLSYILAMSASHGRTDIIKSAGFFHLMDQLQIQFSDACYASQAQIHQSTQTNRPFSPIELAVIYNRKAFIAEAYQQELFLLDDLYQPLALAAQYNNTEMLAFLLDLVSHDHDKPTLKSSLQHQYALQKISSRGSMHRIMYYVLAHKNQAAFDTLLSHEVDLNYFWGTSYYHFDEASSSFRESRDAERNGVFSHIIKKLLHYTHAKDEPFDAINMPRLIKLEKAREGSDMCADELRLYDDTPTNKKNEAIIACIMKWQRHKHFAGELQGETNVVDFLNKNHISLSNLYAIGQRDTDPNNLQYLTAILSNAPEVVVLMFGGETLPYIARALSTGNDKDALMAHCIYGNLAPFAIYKTELDILCHALGSESTHHLSQHIDNFVALLSMDISLADVTQLATAHPAIFNCLIAHGKQLPIWHGAGITLDTFTDLGQQTNGLNRLTCVLELTEHLVPCFLAGSRFHEICDLTHPEPQVALRKLVNFLTKFEGFYQYGIKQALYFIMHNISLTHLVTIALNDPACSLHTVLKNHHVVKALLTHAHGFLPTDFLLMAKFNPKTLENALSNKPTIEEAYHLMSETLLTIKQAGKVISHNMSAFHYTQKEALESGASAETVRGIRI
jgi:hypothetical protein